MKKENNGRPGWKKFVIIGLIPLTVIFIGYIAAVKNLGAERYSDITEWFSEDAGLLGIFLYAYIVDALILPLSPDFIWPIAASFHWYVAIPLTGLASVLGGITSYYIGVLFDRIPAIRRLTLKANEKWGPYINSYGTPFMCMAAVLPMPYSTICTAAGVMRMPFLKALPSILLRFLHAAAYFALFRAGLLLI